ncbi:hypothetical protein ACI3KX_00570 [Microbacterium sp. ZW CA_36]|uniref:hypothetical protein n=1 Tax=Microbacterium sp. ZW CA_36 TaxID=3378078 RepID=UPI0038543210
MPSTRELLLDRLLAEAELLARGAKGFRDGEWSDDLILRVRESADRRVRLTDWSKWPAEFGAEARHRDVWVHHTLCFYVQQHVDRGRAPSRTEHVSVWAARDLASAQARQEVVQRERAAQFAKLEAEAAERKRKALARERRPLEVRFLRLAKLAIARAEKKQSEAEAEASRRRAAHEAGVERQRRAAAEAIERQRAAMAAEIERQRAAIEAAEEERRRTARVHREVIERRLAAHRMDVERHRAAKARLADEKQEAEVRRVRWLNRRTPAPDPQIFGVSHEGAEHLTAMWMRHLGVLDAEVTRYSGDGGVDVASAEYVVQLREKGTGRKVEVSGTASDGEELKRFLAGPRVHGLAATIPNVYEASGYDDYVLVSGNTEVDTADVIRPTNDDRFTIAFG